MPRRAQREDGASARPSTSTASAMTWSAVSSPTIAATSAGRLAGVLRVVSPHRLRRDRHRRHALHHRGASGNVERYEEGIVAEADARLVLAVAEPHPAAALLADAARSPRARAPASRRSAAGSRATSASGTLGPPRGCAPYTSRPGSITSGRASPRRRGTSAGPPGGSPASAGTASASAQSTTGRRTRAWCAKASRLATAREARG